MLITSVKGIPPLFLFPKNFEGGFVMTEFTRIHDRFEYWSVADCACEHCANYRGKKRGCAIEACAVADIREEALRREQAAHSGDTARMEAVPCPA